jgi:hypothetical protein
VGRNEADRFWGQIEATLSQGRTAYLHRSVYVQVDSKVNDEVVGAYDISKLQLLGFDGWEIVTSIPKTVGVGLTNESFGSTMGSTWGGGMGGNVVGAYVLLRYAITAGSVEASRSYIDRLLMGEKI